jgi:hypothetical protein
VGLGGEEWCNYNLKGLMTELKSFGILFINQLKIGEERHD